MYSRLEQQVTAAIANHLRKPVDELESNHDLRRDWGLNNLGLISIALELEATQQGEFPFALLENVHTVSDLIALHLRFVAAERLKARSCFGSFERPLRRSRRRTRGRMRESTRQWVTSGAKP